MSKLRSDVSIDDLNQRGVDYLPGYLGIEVTEIAPESLRSRMPIKQLHIAPNDFLHAASVVALADTTCGYATIAHLPPGRRPSRRSNSRAIIWERSAMVPSPAWRRPSIWAARPRFGMPW